MRPLSWPVGYDAFYLSSFTMGGEQERKDSMNNHKGKAIVSSLVEDFWIWWYTRTTFDIIIYIQVLIGIVLLIIDISKAVGE